MELFLVGVGVIVVILAVVAARKLRSAPPPATPAPSRPRPQVAEFHVRGHRALVTFAVPLPEGDPDPALSELLLHEAIEVVREKRHSLPITEVTEVVALARRGSEPFEVATQELSEPGVLPEPPLPESMPHFTAARFDPLAAVPLGSGMERAPGIAERAKESELAPAGAELRLTASVEAALRAQGVDPQLASASAVVLAVLQLTGHTLQERGDGTYLASGPTGRVYIQVVDHTPGDYPELEERDVDRFMIAFGSSGAAQGLLVSDKYCPFLVYEKERRQPRVRFVTRERLQDFVDGLSV